MRCSRCGGPAVHYYLSVGGLRFCSDCTRDIAVDAIDTGIISLEYLLAKHVKAKP